MKTEIALALGAFWFVFLILNPRFGFAEIYKASVTREESNFYRVEGTSPQIYIKTRYCYEYAYSERALIDTSDMEITFLDSDTTCQIEKNIGCRKIIITCVSVLIRQCSFGLLLENSTPILFFGTHQ